MVEEKETNNYISLQEAIKYCAYTQEYLSLRARQGKLKAVKFGRNWVTTREWLEEYLARVEEYNNNNFKAKKEERAKLPAEKAGSLARSGRVPENLPVGELKLVPVKPLYFQISEIFQQVIKKIIFSPAVRFGFIYGITFVLIITGIVLGKDSLKKIMVDLSVPVKETFVLIQKDEIYSAAIFGTIDVYQEYFEWLGKTLGAPISKIGNSKPVLIIGKTAKDVWQTTKTGYLIVDNFIKEKLAVMTEIFASRFSKLSRFFGQAANEIKKIAFGISERIAGLFAKPLTREGMVVVPSTEKDEEIKTKIKAAFSDEVEVNPKDKESGIIVPMFREKKGEDYMYILVPMNPIK